MIVYIFGVALTPFWGSNSWLRYYLRFSSMCHYIRARPSPLSCTTPFFNRARKNSQAAPPNSLRIVDAELYNTAGSLVHHKMIRRLHSIQCDNPTPSKNTNTTRGSTTPESWYFIGLVPFGPFTLLWKLAFPAISTTICQQVGLHADAPITSIMLAFRMAQIAPGNQPGK